jgi:hypothetical protein
MAGTGPLCQITKASAPKEEENENYLGPDRQAPLSRLLIKKSSHPAHRWRTTLQDAFPAWRRRYSNLDRAINQESLGHASI